MLYFYSAIAAVIPMITYMVIIWRFDRYDREPFRLVMQNYFWGAVGAVILTLIGGQFISFLISPYLNAGEQFKYTETIIVAPFVEEITKGIFLFVIIANKNFDNMTDGIVYGGAIGLGFGMTENFLYFITYSSNLNDWISIIIIRTLFSAVMHCVATATFGALLGYAKFKNIYYKITFPFIGLAFAMLIHMIWNYTVSFQSTAVFGFVFMFFFMIIFIVVFVFSIASEKKIIFNELIEEAENGLIPMHHLNILNSSKRNKPGWVDESIRKLYISAATTLAFRKMQIKNCSKKNKLLYQNEIDYFRNYILTLLSNTLIV